MISRHRAGAAAVAASLQTRFCVEAGLQTRLQQSRIKRQRQQILELVSAGLALEIREDHFEVTAKFPQDLTARTARWRRRFGIGDDGYAPKLAVAL
jgi:hypothetical protein